MSHVLCVCTWCVDAYMRRLRVSSCRSVGFKCLSVGVIMRFAVCFMCFVLLMCSARLFALIGCVVVSPCLFCMFVVVGGWLLACLL